MFYPYAKEPVNTDSIAWQGIVYDVRTILAPI